MRLESKKKGLALEGRMVVKIVVSFEDNNDVDEEDNDDDESRGDQGPLLRLKNTNDSKQFLPGLRKFFGDDDDVTGFQKYLNFAHFYPDG